MPVFHNNTPPDVNVAYYEVPSLPITLPYHRRDYFKIWIIVGESRLHFADKTVYISKDQPAIIFSNPLVPYSFETEDDARWGYWCVFTEQYFRKGERAEGLQESPLFRVGGDNVFFPDKEQFTIFCGLFDKMIAEAASDYVYKHDIIRNYIQLVIHEALKMQPALNGARHRNANERIAAIFTELLERQFPIESPRRTLVLRRAGDYAAALSVHVNHLNFAVREITGKSTTTHIAERIVNEAKALLKHTDWSIADISYCLGFEYPNHFNNFFKKHTAVTPLQFRK
ncbi:AraC family transcriptional regulator [Chitinophaga agri]|uniref:AraC family transcriptional regulator n=2 Tax=Chitinophaga agri TaxID=2703787 RepID=A0A6B9ZNW1_9BACT|nr:AraC family transcriptional regulator [Chitinophaga agri]